MTKVAKLPKDILSRKGMAQPMAASGPLVRASVPAAIDWQAVANSRAPMNLSPGRAPRRNNRGGPAYRQSEPRVRVSLRLDRETHAHLRSFCGFVQRTQQKVLAQALDEFFARHGLDETAGDRRRPTPERGRGMGPERDRRR